MSIQQGVQQSEYFDKIIDRKTDAFFVIDQEGLLRYASESVTKMFGHTPKDLIGKPAKQFIHPEDQQAASLRHSVLLVYPGNRLTADYRVLNAHGDYSWMECIFNNMINIPPVSGIMVQLRDISERKSFELQLEESEERFRLFMHNAPGAVWMRDDKGTYIFLNEGFERMMDLRGKEVLGKTYDEIFPDRIEHIRDTDRICVNYGKTVEYLEKNIGSDGLERDWVIHKFPLPQSNGKTFIGIFAFDVTKLMHADANIKESENRFRQLFDHSPDAIFIEDEEGVILDANKKAAELQGLPVFNLVGKNILELIPETEPENEKNKVRQTYKQLFSGEINQLNSLVWKTDGKKIPVDLRASRITYGKKPALILTLRERLY